MARDVDHRPDGRLAVVLGTLVVAAPAVLSTWAWSVRGRLPDEVARHWGAGGRVTGTWSLETTLVVTAVLVLVAALPLGLVAVLGRQPTVLRRLLAGLAAWLTVFVTALAADGLRGQLDLADPAAAPVPGAGMGVGTLLGLLAAILVGAAARDRPAGAVAPGPPPPEAPRLPPERSDPARWQTRVTPPPELFVVLGVSALIMVAFAAVATWWLLVLVPLVAGLCAATMLPTVTVDGDGLTVRSPGGLRLVHVPVAQVVEAGVRDVDPFWEFGGWGLRVTTAGRVGVVGRSGPAVVVRRGDGGEVVVSTDDAPHAAAMLNTLADRHHRAGEPA